MNWKLSNCHYLFGAKCQRYCKSTSLRLGSYDDHFGTWGCCIRMKEVILIVDMWKDSLAIPVTSLELDVERYCKSTSLRLRCSWIYVCVSCVFDFKTNYLVLARIEHYGLHDSYGRFQRSRKWSEFANMYVNRKLSNFNFWFGAKCWKILQVN